MTADKIVELLKRFPFVEPECKFNFGDGWAKIIMGFCGAVRFLSADALRITQLESRDGKLNIEYVSDCNNSALDKTVARAEMRSVNICEHCGHEFPSNYTLGTRMHMIRNREVRLCPVCVDQYMTLRLQGNETAFKI